MNSTTDINELLWFDADKCYINGVWCEPGGGDYLPLYNPSNGELLIQIARGGADDIDQAVQAAQQARRSVWGASTALERSRLLMEMSRRVSAKVETLAAIEALDVGKPLSQSRADAIALARYLEFYAGAADKIHGETLPFMDGYTVYTLREPHGVTGHIVPWNYPMQIIGRSVGAALTMGNAIVLKPAEQACLTALAFAAIADEVGFPPGVINVVPGLGTEAGHALSSHAGVQHISFTGSVATGAAVQTAAAANVIPVTLELGGKSPQLVFDDADLSAALPYLINSGIQNAGQTCSAASRLLVHRRVYDNLVEQLSERYRALTVGPALDDLSVGPLISSMQCERVEQFVSQGEDLECVATGTLIADAPEAGFYTLPRLFAGVDPAHVLAQQEIFGPVQVVIPFDDDDQAVAIANGTDYGLVAALWTRDGARQMRLAKQLDVGQVFINNYGAGGGVELPFGGVGKSGHGREKGFEALHGFSRLKTVAAHHG